MNKKCAFRMGDNNVGVPCDRSCSLFIEGEGCIVSVMCIEVTNLIRRVINNEISRKRSEGGRDGSITRDDTMYDMQADQG